jgi:hypothetical protein
MSKFFLFAVVSMASIYGLLYGADQLRRFKPKSKKRAALAIGGGIVSAFIWFILEVNHA